MKNRSYEVFDTYQDNRLILFKWWYFINDKRVFSP